MKKTIFAFLLLIATTCVAQQTSDRFQFLQNGKILFDTTIVRPINTITKDSIVYVKTPCDTTKPSTQKSMLYVDGLNNRLGNAVEETKLIQYTLQTGFNGWAEYDLGLIIGNSTKESQLRSLHERARAAGILYFEGVTSGSASSVSDRIAFNTRCTNASQKFTSINAEWEPWNQTDLNAAAAKDSTQLKNQYSKAIAAGLGSCEYWGWLSKQPFIQTSFITMVLKNMTHLPHHYYQKTINISYHATELDSMNAIGKRLGIVFDTQPIFSSETAFSQDELKTKTPQQLYAAWKTQFDAKKYSNLKSTGFYMFAMSYLEFAIPYKKPTSAIARGRETKFLHDSFSNGTTKSHLDMTQNDDQ